MARLIARDSFPRQGRQEAEAWPGAQPRPQTLKGPEGIHCLGLHRDRTWALAWRGSPSGRPWRRRTEPTSLGSGQGGASFCRRGAGGGWLVGQGPQARAEDRKGGDVTTPAQGFSWSLNHLPSRCCNHCSQREKVAEIPVFPFACVCTSRLASAVRGPGLSRGLWAQFRSFLSV